MVSVKVADLLRMFACIDLWSIIDKDGIPILDSPLSRVQTRRFSAYLQRRDHDRETKLWSQYIVTAPAAVFPEERLFHRRAKTTKLVFNWYLRSEHVHKGPVDTMSLGVEGAGVVVGSQSVLRTAGGECQLCGQGVMGDSERHLYVSCSRPEIGSIRVQAEDEINQRVEEAGEGLLGQVLQAVQKMMLTPENRQLTWKGIITRDQGIQIAEIAEGQGLADRQLSGLIGKQVKVCMGIGGTALLDMRKMAWKLGGMVRRNTLRDPGPTSKRGRESSAAVSIAATMGIMSPAEAVLWELERRKKRRAREKGHRDRIRRLPKIFAGNSDSKIQRGASKGARRQQSRQGPSRSRNAKQEGVEHRLWDVH